MTEAYPSVDQSELYTGEPGDYLEEALLSFKPGTKTGFDIAYAATLMAGLEPIGITAELERVAQDLVDNDTRMIEGEKII